MQERGLEPEFPPEALAEAERLEPAKPGDGGDAARDLRELPWFSIDNDDTRDLDQLTVAERVDGAIRLRVAVADVDALVRQGSALDDHARTNTTSVYTAARVFPMIPERLSTGLTSMNPGEDRLAMVIEMVMSSDGSLAKVDIFPAFVHNHAKLTYNAVAAWLDGEGPAPFEAPPALGEQIRLQDEAAESLRRRRSERGALEFEMPEAKPVFSGDAVVGLEEDRRNRAKELIQDFMIAANSATAGFLEERRYPSLRRVVRTPKRWPRIVEIARALGQSLPEEPDSPALAAFLTGRRRVDPESFPELSTAVVKLLGSGEYVVDLPERPAPGHFGLATGDYTHATAPNRRYPDLITHRLLKAALAGRPSPYSPEDLEELARHCTRKEDDATKVERLVRKAAAALLLSGRIGERFDAVVTGASEKGTWVRLLRPPVEGRLERGFQGLDVGDRVRVRLTGTNVGRGFIDFVRD